MNACRVILAAVALSACLLSTSAVAQNKAEHRAVAKRLRAIHEARQAHHDRLQQVSSMFLGKAFQLSPLGEGRAGRVDSDPIARFDRFDCVTYVEEVMALSWHADLDRAIKTLQRVRYADGEIRYGARKHIMMAQWIPQNVAAGFVTDITRNVAAGDAITARLALSPAHFTSKLGAALALDRGDRPLGDHAVAMLPLSVPQPRMAAALRRIPHGTVMTTIRSARPGVPYRASHVGLVVVKDGRRMLRHAHQKRGRVVEEPLADFVAAARRFRRWPVAGFNLLAIARRPPASAR